MPQEKSCKICSKKYEISDDDLAFLDKISPEFGGKKYQILPSTLCLECNQLQHLAWRNERSIYKRKCDKSSQETLSIYSPDKPYAVYSQKEWYKDDWDPLKYGQEFDFSRPFFEQYDELLKKVPRLAINITDAENCEFCNSSWHIKDSYLAFNVGYSEKCHYCTQLYFSNNCIDCFDVKKSEYLYRSFDCNNCQKSSHLEHCENCYDCHFCYDCKDCQDVVLSTNLRKKQYCIENKQLSKEEYFEQLKRISLGKRSSAEKLRAQLEKAKKEAIRCENNNVKTENSSGDYLVECNNCSNCFNGFRSADCKYVNDIDNDVKDSRYVDYAAENELCYNGVSLSGYKNILGAWIVYGRDLIYCNVCMNCSNCFGCTGLQHKEYCILNKQYSKEEYEKLMPKIIEHMTKTGEWGEFFPMSMSPFGYNESIAQIYYPKTKEEAVKLGAKWLDKDYSIKFEGEYYEPKDDIAEYINSGDERKRLLEGILKCSETGKPFKIMPQELAFYIENQIPIPSKHSETRYMGLFKLRNPRNLYHRQCMCNRSGHDHEARCKTEFETTYAPDRTEKVYCEKCYQKSVI